MIKRMIFPLVFGLVGIGILISLGVWQVQRMSWKNAGLDEIAEKITAAPIRLPLIPIKEKHNRLSVSVDVKLGSDEIHVITSKKNSGPGFLVIIPAFETTQKRDIMIDMGFVSVVDKDKKRLPLDVKIIGNLLWPNETDGFTPKPDLNRNIWFARDVDKMAAYFKTEPVLLVAREIIGESYGPIPIVIGHNIPNDHKEYAITWFSLAFVWFGMTLYLLWRIKERTL